MEAGQVLPLERAWCCSGFAIITDVRSQCPALLVPEFGVPMLVVPAEWDAAQRDRACGWAIVELFHRRYGWLAIVQAISAWDTIVANLSSGRDRDIAAD